MIHIVYPQPSLYLPHRRASYVSLNDALASAYDDYSAYLPRRSQSPFDYDSRPFSGRASAEAYPMGGPAAVLNPFFAAAAPSCAQSFSFAGVPENRRPRRQPTRQRRGAIHRRSQDESAIPEDFEAFLQARAEAEARARIEADRREIERAREVERQREAVRREHQQRLQREVERQRSVVREALGELISALTGEEVASQGVNDAPAQARPTAAPKVDVEKSKVQFAEPVEQRAPPPQPSPTMPAAPAPTKPAESVPTVQQPERPSSPKDLSLDRLSTIDTRLTNLIHTFALPRYLDFTSPDTPQLSYTPQNAPVHGYEESLNRVISDLDGVESDGDDEVRKRRRDVVRRAERELRWLDEEVRRAWERKNAPVVEETEVLASEREVEVDEFKATKDALADLLGHHGDEAPAPETFETLGAEATVPVDQSAQAAEEESGAAAVEPVLAVDPTPATVEEWSVTSPSAFVGTTVEPLVEVEDATVVAAEPLPSLFQSMEVTSEPVEAEASAASEGAIKPVEAPVAESVPQSPAKDNDEPSTVPPPAILETIEDTTATETRAELSPVASPLLEGAFVATPSAEEVKTETEVEDKKEVISEEESVVTEESEYEML